MKDFEVKIWANPSGFKEITSELPSEVFDDASKRLFNPDSFDAIPCEDYYSIFYLTSSYVISRHFLTSCNGFRDRRVTISIAVKRKYKLCNNLEVFENVSKKFEEIVKTGISDLNELNYAIKQYYSEIENCVRWNVMFESEQLSINVRNVNVKKWTTFDGDMELSSLLNTPMRGDLSGVRLLLLMPKKEENSWREAVSQIPFVSIPVVYTHIYSVYLSCNLDKPIASVHSLDEEINVNILLQNCKPLKLTGKISEHLDEWKVKLSEDGCSVILGVIPDVIRETYRVKVFDNYNEEIMVSLAWMSFNFGHLDGNKREITFAGEEIDKLKRGDLQLNNNDGSNKYFTSKCDVSFLQDAKEIKVRGVISGFTNPLNRISQIIFNKYSTRPKFSLFFKAKERSEWVRWDYLPFTPDEYTFVIKESESYSQSPEYDMSIYVHSGKINEEKIKKIQLSDEDVHVHFELSGITKKEHESNAIGFYKSNGGKCQYSLPAGDDSMSMERKKCDYILKMKGFRDGQLSFEPQQTKYTINLKPKATYFIGKHWQPVVGVFVGVLIGFLIWSDTLGKISDGEEGGETALCDTINVLRVEKNSLNDSIEHLNLIIMELGNKIYQIQHDSQQDLQNEEEQVKKQYPNVGKNKSLRRDNINLADLITKLTGLRWTENDLQNAERLNGADGQYSAFLTKCKAAAAYLRYNSRQSKDKKGNIVGVSQNYYKINRTNMYDKHREALDKIITNEDNFAQFKNDSNDYNNLQEIINKYCN